MSWPEKQEKSTKIRSPDFTGGMDSTKSSEPSKRSLERIARSASIDSNGELHFVARSNSSTSVKLTRSNSSFEDSLRERRESMGLPSLQQPVEALILEAQPATVDATQRRKKFGQSRMKLPLANVKVRPVHPIPVGGSEDGGVVNEGVEMQDLNSKHLFYDSEEENDNFAESGMDIYLEPAQSISKYTTVSQPHDAYKESKEEKIGDIKVIKRKFLPINPQNLNKTIAACSEERYEKTKDKIIVSDMPVFPYVRNVSILVSYSDDIRSTRATTYIPGIQSFVVNGQKKTFESDSFDIFISETKQFGYQGKIVTIISPKRLSIGFALLKGKDDNKLPWPFNMMILFKIVNMDDRKSLIRGFRSDINGSKFSQCLSRPSGCNMAIGFPHFMSAAALSDGFIENDTLKIIARLSPKKYVSLSEVQLELPSIVRP